MSQPKKATVWSRNFLCVFFANALQTMSHSSCNALVSTYATHLGAGPKIMGLLTGMFFGIALAMRPVAGPVTTRVDNRKLLFLAYVLGVIANAGYALFHSVGMFMAFRVIHGIQYAFLGSLCMTIAADSLPAEKLASGLGIFGMGTSIATSVAPRVGLWLRDYGTALRDTDFGFTLVFSFATVMLVLALIPVVLIRQAPREKSPELLGKWYNNIISVHALIPACTMMLVITGYSLFNAYMVPYGEELGVAGIGTFFTVQALALLAIRPVFGRLADRWGARRIFYPGAVLLIAAFLVIGNAKTLSVIICGALLASLGYGALYPSVQSLCIQVETPAKRAVASNTLYAGLDLGFFLGPLLGGFIRDAATYRAVLLSGSIPVFAAAVLFTAGWGVCQKRLAFLAEQK